MRRFTALLFFASALAAADRQTAVKVNGWLDVADCSTIGGWAWDATSAAARSEVNLYDGSTSQPFATVTADRFRSDLVRAGIGDGAHGFSVATPTQLKDGGLHTIVATMASNGAPIEIGQNTLSCPADSSGYTYYFSDSLGSLNAASWLQQGQPSIASAGLTSASPAGASLISQAAVPDGTSNYEVRALLNLGADGGTYALYLHASPDALSGPASSGSYYAVELQNPTFTSQGCSATLAVSKRTSETVTSLQSETVPCHDGMVLRAVYSADGTIGVWLDHSLAVNLQDSEIATGQPGIGVRGAPASNGIGQVDFGGLDRLAPSPLEPADVAVKASSTSVQLKWPELTDDPNGTGVGVYTVSRNGGPAIQVSRVEPSFVDKGLTPGTTYTYEIVAYDVHMNQTSTFVTVATPAANASQQ